MKNSTRPVFRVVADNSQTFALAAEARRRQRDDTLARLRQARDSARKPLTVQELDRRLALMEENPDAVQLSDVGIYGPPPS